MPPSHADMMDALPLAEVVACQGYPLRYMLVKLNLETELAQSKIN